MWWHVEIRILIIKGCEIERCIKIFRSNDETTGQVRQTHVVSFQQYLENWNWREIFKFSELQFLLDLLCCLSTVSVCKLLIFCYFLAESWVVWLPSKLSVKSPGSNTDCWEGWAESNWRTRLSFTGLLCLSSG